MSGILDEINTKKRRELLPWWIKFFIWFFLLTGALIPICLVFGVIGYDFPLAIYGLESISPFTVNGGIILMLLILKSVVAYGLWWEKDWGITLGIIDASIGIIVCLFTMLILPFFADGNNIYLGLRLELILLIPYLIKLFRLKRVW